MAQPVRAVGEHDNERLRTELAATHARIAKLEDTRRAAFISRAFMPPQVEDELERVAAQMRPELFAMFRLETALRAMVRNART